MYILGAQLKTMTSSQAQVLNNKLRRSRKLLRMPHSFFSLVKHNMLFCWELFFSPLRLLGSSSVEKYFVFFLMLAGQASLT